MQFSSRDVVHLCYDAANYFDIARVMVGEDRRENAIPCKIYIHEYLSERTRPLWYISPTIESTRWIVCDGQRMRVMENRRATPRSSLRMQRCFWVTRDSSSTCRGNSRNRVFPFSSKCRLFECFHRSRFSLRTYAGISYPIPLRF